MFVYSAYCLLPTAYCLLPTAYCLLPTAYCLLLTAYCLLPTAYCLLPTAYCLLPTAYCLLPTAYCVVPLRAHAPCHVAPARRGRPGLCGRGAPLHLATLPAPENAPDRVSRRRYRRVCLEPVGLST